MSRIKYLLDDIREPILVFLLGSFIITILGFIFIAIIENYLPLNDIFGGILYLVLIAVTMNILISLNPSFSFPYYLFLLFPSIFFFVSLPYFLYNWFFESVNPGFLYPSVALLMIVSLFWSVLHYDKSLINKTVEISTVRSVRHVFIVEKKEIVRYQGVVTLFIFLVLFSVMYLSSQFGMDISLLFPITLLSVIYFFITFKRISIIGVSMEPPGGAVNMFYLGLHSSSILKLSLIIIIANYLQL